MCCLYPTFCSHQSRERFPVYGGKRDGRGEWCTDPGAERQAQNGRPVSASLILETIKIDKLETGVGLMPSLIRSSRRKTWIGFLALILVVCVYIYFVPQKVLSERIMHYCDLYIGVNKIIFVRSSHTRDCHIHQLFSFIGYPFIMYQLWSNVVIHFKDQLSLLMS